MRAQQLMFKVAAMTILAGAAAGAGLALGDLSDARRAVTVIASGPLPVTGPPAVTGPSAVTGPPVATEPPAATGPPAATEPPVPRPAPVPVSSFRAPLYYQPFGSDVDIVGRALDASGARALILAFVLDAGGCRPAWQGDPARRVGADAAVAATIDSVRRRGGDVSVSFGGAAGTELGAGCATERALADAYQKVVETHDLTRIDLDYEADDLTAGIGKRMRAVRLLLDRAGAAHRPLRISLTLPVTRAGLPPAGLGALRAALDAGIRPDVVNLMAFNLGPGTATADIQGAVEAAHRQVKGLLGGTDAQVYARLGLQMMIGRADVRGEELSPAEARSLVDYTRRRHLGWVSFWSLNRDQACPTPAPAQPAVPTCSGVAQRPYEFASIVAGYAG